jgi:deazaflavin-dependent oxidoreductase (nitroreductase family)
MEEFPRKGSALHKMLRGDKETTKKSLHNWKKINKLVVFFYELGLLPLLGAGWYILLLYTKGRRTGKNRVTPLEYRRRGKSVFLFSARGKRSDWYRNIKTNPNDAKLRMGFKTLTPIVEFIEEDEEVEEILRWYVKMHPRSSKMIFGWDPSRDDPEKTDLTSLIKTFKIVKLSL